ncbi:hypothetical protein D9M68_512900 [compost metagenome]|uniref:Uncharacterized protein n=1 Tax=Achromobacter agilis TaxID=1353888 RepID=A0A446CHZ2_9BURK|nr:hypothetical protein [Achromobacter agilis]SSW67482.1 hypothetical protein AGI3411_03145 [Achromobacter agilis]
MLETLLAHVPLEALAVRMLATAFVVMAVSWAVGAFGPLIGGALAGLPIILGPGFYFLSAQASPAFVAQTAAYALLSLCATQCFLLAYIATAEKTRPWTCLAYAVGAWLLAALVLRLLPASALSGGIMFVLVTGLCLRAGRRFLMPRGPARGKAGFGLLLLRGLLAGMLVAAVTTASQWLGATGAGLLLAFPIGYSVVAVTIHQKLGSANLIATLYAALLGTASLASFCAALALAAAHWTANAALAAALMVSMSLTLGLVLRRRAVAARA